MDIKMRQFVITDLDPADAYYHDRDKFIGIVVEAERVKTWAAPARPIGWNYGKYYPTPLSYMVIRGREMKKGELFCFHAVRLKEVGYD